jgi:hypothetical protein
MDCTYKNSSPNILSEENTLELDDEEVQKLLYIIEKALKRLLRDDKVLLRAHPGNQAISHHRSTRDFRRSRYCVNVSLEHPK